jgi:uncharacterized membrane protein YjjP (DUF1212 family)
MLLLVGIATYFRSIYYGPLSLYSVVLWIVAVPMSFLATVKGVRSHPFYRPFMYGGFVTIGVLQYLDDDWFVLAGVFIAGGIIGLITQFHH